MLQKTHDSSSQSHPVREVSPRVSPVSLPCTCGRGGTESLRRILPEQGLESAPPHLDEPRICLGLA